MFLRGDTVRLLDQDEVFVLQTAGVPSVRAVIDVQRHYPISLDPMFYHLLSHALRRAAWRNGFCHSPAFGGMGYLLMQVCLFRVGKMTWR